MKHQIYKGSGIKAKVVRELCDALKVNTRLKTFGLGGEQTRQATVDVLQKGMRLTLCTNTQTGDNFCAEKAYALSDALKANTTLTTLQLYGKKTQEQLQ